MKRFLTIFKTVRYSGAPAHANKFCILLAIVITSFSALSCSQDNPVEPPTDMGKEIVGTYKGTLGISLGEASVGEMQKNVEIVSDVNSTVNIRINNFSLLGISLGTISLSNCNVLYDESMNGHLLSAEQSVTLENGIGQCDVILSGTVINGCLVLDLEITVANLDEKVFVHFDGILLSGNESSEAEILTFVFDHENPANSSVAGNPSIGKIQDGNAIIGVSVEAGSNDAGLAALVPTITVSEKAEILPASGEPIDLSNGKSVTYTVTAEDGTVNFYKVSVTGSALSYDFEVWDIGTEAGAMYEDTPVLEGWASCNDAVGLVKNLGSLGGISYTGDYPVRSTSESVNGLAVLMESVDTQGGSIFGQQIPKVTAGSIFLGSFNAFAAMTDPMSTTKFGIMFNYIPLEVRGYYRYAAGSEFYDAKGILQPDIKDECSMSAVLYEVSSDSEEEILDGNDIYTSERIVAMGTMTSGDVNEFTEFSLELEYKKEYDPDKLYRFAVIFSASKEGNAYRAAVGSTLIIDNVTIVCR